MKRFPELLGKPLDTWKGMANHIGRTPSWLKSHRKELFEQGVVRTKLIHRPPNRRKVAYTFSLLLEFWYLEKFKEITPKEKLSLLNDTAKYRKRKVKGDGRAKDNHPPETPASYTRRG